jgi:dienelactone hydrolase
MLKRRRRPLTPTLPPLPRGERGARARRGRVRCWHTASRQLFRSLLLSIAVVTWLGAGTVSAGSLVEFPNVSDNAPPLVGYLARPDAGLSRLAGGAARGEAPYPAVVVLHGCGGISSHSIGIADKLGSWGYVALAIDSLGPRGIASACGGGVVAQPYDAHAALRYLAQQEFVDPVRIAVLGQSMGGGAALHAIDRDISAQYFAERFRAAVAYYPGCTPLPRFTAPVLILIGDADDWTLAERCRAMAGRPRPDSAPIAMTIYPGVHHAFDVAWLQPGRRSFGHWIEYNEAAARDAEEMTRAFLAAHLAGSAEKAPAK